MIIYAKKDEVATCENGHPVFKFRKTVLCGDAQYSEDNIFFDNQTKPQDGTLPHKCLCHCGARYFAIHTRFHFKDGWR